MAALLGHEAAVFLPSGTMCNEIAIRLHIRPGGDEILLGARDPSAALRGRRAGGAVGRGDDRRRRRGGHVHARTRSTRRSARTPPATATPRARASSASSSRRTWAAGASGRSSRSRPSLEVAREHGLRTHLDGARLMNAVVASGVDAATWARGFDTAWLDFTKGLGAPVGACLAGSRGAHRRGVALEADARRRDAPGGHRRRRRACTRSTTTSTASPTTTRARVASPRASPALPGVDIDAATVETNIVVFGVPDAPAFCARSRARTCVVMLPLGPAASARSRTSTSTTRGSSRHWRPHAARSGRSTATRQRDLNHSGLWNAPRTAIRREEVRRSCRINR